MDLRLIKGDQRDQYNQFITHPMQSWEWGEFRQKLRTKLLRYGLYQNNKLVSAFQLTFHKIPLTNFFVGYLPKGPFPGPELAEALEKIGKEHQCAFIKIEPNIQITEAEGWKLEIDPRFKPSPKPLFTKYNFILDLTKSEEEILQNMHPKCRYNIRVAQKHGVWVEERTDDEAFKDYLQLYFATTRRQGYHGHNLTYHKLVWRTLKAAKMARLLIAYLQPPTPSHQGRTRLAKGGTNQKLPLVAWMLFNFKDTLYYPYGGSSDEYKNVMASNLVAWEAIKLGKKLGLNNFDLWGALGPKASPNNPWQGFHQFKEKLGGDIIEYLPTFDLVLNLPVYHLFTLIDRLMPLKLFLLSVTGR